MSFQELDSLLCSRGPPFIAPSQRKMNDYLMCRELLDEAYGTTL